ncbi:MAG: type II secretion system major pseudopilin GspG [Deltaproteobacteria bacterium]
MNWKQRKEAGFTLIEIMVVVFIMGLLVTLVAPKILGRTDDARATKAAADIRSVEQALSLYKLDNGHFPTTDQGIEALVRQPSSGPQARRWRAYLDNVPTDPWDMPFIYESDGRDYLLLSFGADGIEGGQGVDADIDSRDLG